MSEESINELKARIESDHTELESIESNKYEDISASLDQHSQTSSLAVLLIGILFALIVAYLISKDKNPGDVLRACGTILIIISAIYLVVAGYSEEQIAPVIGLLGTIAGYILGKSTGREHSSKKSSENNNVKNGTSDSINSHAEDNKGNTKGPSEEGSHK
ncbi:hypothetical protein ACJJIU_08165 [Microbulbifer sp. CnH-101-E]|uniref:hypothetical protein n=1 Tax=unclassified Microbulbifer TaxID=2619833 RepID=UPI004039E91C